MSGDSFICESPYTCTVCLCETGDIVEECMECANRFHHACWQSWMALSSTCPVCRTVVKGRTLKSSPPSNTPNTQLSWAIVGGFLASLFLLLGSMMVFCFLYYFFEQPVFLICAMAEIAVFFCSLMLCISVKTEAEVEIIESQTSDEHGTRPQQRRWMTRILLFQLSESSTTSVSPAVAETTIVAISSVAG